MKLDTNNCPNCKGVGNYSLDADDAEFIDCHMCNGTGQLPILITDEVIEQADEDEEDTEDYPTMSDLLEQFRETNHLHNFEGNTGVARFEKIVKQLGYKEQPFKNGSPIEEFLADNSGAIEALLLWIGHQNVEEWREALEE
jgi:hypothetical protein